MTLRADGFCVLRIVLPARSIARQTGFIRDRTLGYFPTTPAAGANAFVRAQRRSRVGDAYCRAPSR